MLYERLAQVARANSRAASIDVPTRMVAIVAGGGTAGSPWIDGTKVVTVGIARAGRCRRRSSTTS